MRPIFLCEREAWRLDACRFERQPCGQPTVHQNDRRKVHWMELVRPIPAGKVARGLPFVCTEIEEVHAEILACWRCEMTMRLSRDRDKFSHRVSTELVCRKSAGVGELFVSWCLKHAFAVDIRGP